MKKNKVLYVASTASHLRRFHRPYLDALQQQAEVLTMANGDGVDFSVPFAKSFFSLTNLRCVFQIRKILKKERFDAILVHTALAAFLVRLSLFGKRERPYVLNTVHGYLFPKNVKGMKDRFLLFCEKRMWRWTDDIAVMNREDMEIAKMHRLCRGEVFFTHGMGVPPTDHTVDSEKASAVRAAFGVTSQDFLCTFVGELSGRKHQVFLIDGISELRRRGLPVKLLLVGEGDERPQLEEKIKDLHLSEAVFLAGNCEPVTPYLMATDLYVSASRSEGLPFNIMEAMDLGLPIVASDTKGQTDLLETAEGCLYAADDLSAFCRAVEAVLQGKNSGIGSQRYPILEQYRLSAVFDDYMKILMLGLKTE